MGEYVLVVLTDPAAGRDDEFNDWYTNQHLREVLEVPGFKSAERFKVVGAGTGGKPAQGYLALYKVEAPSWEEAAKRLGGRVGDGTIFMSDALDRDKVQSFYVESIAERKASA